PSTAHRDGCGSSPLRAAGPEIPTPASWSALMIAVLVVPGRSTAVRRLLRRSLVRWRAGLLARWLLGLLTRLHRTRGIVAVGSAGSRRTWRRRTPGPGRRSPPGRRSVVRRSVIRATAGGARATVGT